MLRFLLGSWLLWVVSPLWAQGAQALSPVVEIEEEVYSYVPANNGASPTWCIGAPVLVRIGEDLFATGLETIPDAEPLHNVRWTFYRRTADGWQLQHTDPVGRTREPCPLVGFPDGRLLMSANPTLVPDQRAGPARPELVEFHAARPKDPFKIHLPQWDGEPEFREHSYRFFAADAANAEVIMLNQIGYSHKEWALRKRDGTWAAGRLINIPSREGDIHAYQRGGKLHRYNYGSVVLRDREVHVTGCVSYANWDRMGEKELEELLGGESARQRLGSLANRRRMMYAWTPDITTTPFSEWLEVGSTMATGGWLFPGDLWVAPDGAVHILWYEGPLDRRLRDERFPDIKLTHAIKHAIVREGKLVHRGTLLEGGEGLGGEIPGTTHPRFQITPDHRLLAVYYVSGTNARGEPVSENRLTELLPDGAMKEPVVLPLEHPFRVLFTATPRGGSPPSTTLDLFGVRAAGPAHTLCYARVRLW